MVFGKNSISTNLPEEISDEEASNEGEEIAIQSNKEIEENASKQQRKQNKVPKQQHQDLKPLLREVSILGASNGKNPGGAKSWSCNYCKNQFISSYTRIHYHCFGPPPGKKAGIQRCPALLKDRSTYEKVRRNVEVAEKSGSLSQSLKHSTISLEKIKKIDRPIKSAFNMMGRDMVDLKVMRGLCANGIPFNVLRNPQFCEMVAAINKAPKGYKPPSFEKARTTLLDECKRDVEKDLTLIKDTWYTQGVSIVSDGWTNVKHQPLINVIASNCRGSMFMYANEFSGIEKTGGAIANYLSKAIEEIGSSNVLQEIYVFKHIFWSPCVVHTLNLIFKDFALKFDWLKETYKRGKCIVKYIINHTHALSIFRAQSKLELLKVAKTRFASHYILLKQLLVCREALACTVVLKSWKEWVKHGDEKMRLMGSLVGETIISEEFWEEVENIIAITKPLYLMIKFSDGEGSKLGDVYERMDNMLGELKDVMKNNKYENSYEEMEAIVLERWGKMNIPIHCLGFALSPKFYDSHYLATPAPGGIPRRPPNLDKEVVMGVMEAFKKIAENGKEEKLIREQFAIFHMKKGIYNMVAAQTDAMTMDPIDWWSIYGAETPELAEVAKKVLSQPISSSSAERNWSTYSYIHSVKRNRLNCGRADKLVFIHSNIRLQSRFHESYKDGPSRKWDIDPESSNLEDSIVRLEDMRWDSLEQEDFEIPNIEGEENEERRNKKTRQI